MGEGGGGQVCGSAHLLPGSPRRVGSTSLGLQIAVSQIHLFSAKSGRAHFPKHSAASIPFCLVSLGSCTLYRLIIKE
jgi:hypothetical protein